MKYYKVLKNGRVVDVLDHLVYVKYQEKHDVFLICDENEAQGLMSADGRTIWHLPFLYRPQSNHGVCAADDLVEIEEFEYDSLKALCLKTQEEIIDAYTLSLLKGGIL